MWHSEIETSAIWRHWARAKFAHASAGFIWALVTRTAASCNYGLFILGARVYHTLGASASNKGAKRRKQLCCIFLPPLINIVSSPAAPVHFPHWSLIKIRTQCPGEIARQIILCSARRRNRAGEKARASYQLDFIRLDFRAGRWACSLALFIYSFYMICSNRVCEEAASREHRAQSCSLVFI